MGRHVTTAESNKRDAVYSQVLFLGISGMPTELIIGTPGGVARTRDVRILSGPESKLNSEFLLKFNSSFDQYIDPSEQFPDRVQIQTGVIAHDELPPEVDTSTSRRRMRPAPSK